MEFEYVLLNLLYGTVMSVIVRTVFISVVLNLVVILVLLVHSRFTMNAYLFVGPNDL